MVGAITQKNRLLEIQSALFEKDKLIMTGFSGHEFISRLFKFQIDFFSEDSLLTADQLIGKPIGFQVHQLENVIRYFHGIVSRFSIGSRTLREGQNYQIEVVPWLWLLTCTKDCAIYQNKTAIEIITDVFKKYNFSDYSIADVKGVSSSRLYCVQYQETAFDFVSRLMEEEGVFYYFRFEKDKHILVLADSISTYKPAYESALTYSSNKATDTAINRWESSYQFNVGIYSESFYDFEKPKNKIQSQANTTVDLANIKKFENYSYRSMNPDNITTKDSSIKNIMQATDAQYNVISGASNAISFSSGMRFTLNAPELDIKNLEFALLEIFHQAYDTTHFTSDNAGQNYQNTFLCLPATTPLKPLRVTTKPLICGLQTATVVGPPDEEIFTDKYGRIKIQFHWDRVGKNDDKSSCWIRVSQIWAGNQWGAIFIPRIGQEVVISFLEGDPDQPLVVGSVYNASLMPPYSLPTNGTQSGLKSASSKGDSADNANEIRLEDKKGDELFYLHAQKDFFRSVENDDKLEVQNNQNIKIKQNRSIEITEGDEETVIKKGASSLTIDQGNRDIKISQGDLTIEVSAGKCLLKAAQSIEFQVGQNTIKIDPSGISIKGMKISFEGTMIEGKADASLKFQGAITEVDGSGMLKLQGGITMIN